MQESTSSTSATATQEVFASEMRSPAERSPGTPSNSAATIPKNTARLIRLLRSVRDCSASMPALSSSSPSSITMAISLAIPTNASLKVVVPSHHG